MRTTWSNTKNPRLIRSVSITGAAIGLALIALPFIFRTDSGMFIAIGWNIILYAFLYYNIKFRKVEIDDEKGTLTVNSDRKYPLDIASIATIQFKMSRNGRFRSMFIHDTGVRFEELFLSEKNAREIADRLVALNPSIEVRQERSF